MKNNFTKHFQDKWWLARLAYPVEIFNKLNTLNTSLLGKKNRILEMEIKEFAAHLSLWRSLPREHECSLK